MTTPRPMPGVILVGGSSTRFGSDKLLAPLSDGSVLVDRPVLALRRAILTPVLAVGACDPRVLERFDGVIDDPYPGAGPIGGILSTLEALEVPIFVLAGDLLAITPATIRQIIDAAENSPNAHAVLGDSGQTQWTLGIYRPGATPFLRAALDRGEHALKRALASATVLRIPVEASVCRNINRPEDLPGADLLP